MENLRESRAYHIFMILIAILSGIALWATTRNAMHIYQQNQTDSDSSRPGHYFYQQELEESE